MQFGEASQDLRLRVEGLLSGLQGQRWRSIGFRSSEVIRVPEFGFGVQGSLISGDRRLSRGGCDLYTQVVGQWTRETAQRPGILKPQTE